MGAEENDPAYSTGKFMTTKYFITLVPYILGYGETNLLKEWPFPRVNIS
jgi:hypothetical protein